MSGGAGDLVGPPRCATPSNPPPPPQIRKQAIKDLPQLCRENRTFLPKIADVLAQLLQSEEATEIKDVHSSLTLLFKIDAKGAATATLPGGLWRPPILPRTNVPVSLVCRSVYPSVGGRNFG